MWCRDLGEGYGSIRRLISVRDVRTFVLHCQILSFCRASSPVRETRRLWRNERVGPLHLILHCGISRETINSDDVGKSFGGGIRWHQTTGRLISGRDAGWSCISESLHFSWSLAFSDRWETIWEEESAHQTFSSSRHSYSPVSGLLFPRLSLFALLRYLSREFWREIQIWIYLKSLQERDRWSDGPGDTSDAQVQAEATRLR